MEETGAPGVSGVAIEAMVMSFLKTADIKYLILWALLNNFCLLRVYHVFFTLYLSHPKSLNHTATEELVLFQLLSEHESFLWWPWRACWGRGFLLGTEMLYCQLLWLWEEQTSWSDAAFFQVLASLSKNCLINPENRGKNGRRNSVSQPQSDSVELEERPIPSHLYTNFRHMLIPKGSSRWEHHSSTL